MGVQFDSDPDNHDSAPLEYQYFHIDELPYFDSDHWSLKYIGLFIPDNFESASLSSTLPRWHRIRITP